jgi:hypothetical protein
MEPECEEDECEAVNHLESCPKQDAAPAPRIESDMDHYSHYSSSKLSFVTGSTQRRVSSNPIQRAFWSAPWLEAGAFDQEGETDQAGSVLCVLYLLSL